MATRIERDLSYLRHLNLNSRSFLADTFLPQWIPFRFVTVIWAKTFWVLLVSSLSYTSSHLSVNLIISTLYLFIKYHCTGPLPLWPKILWLMSPLNYLKNPLNWSLCSYSCSPILFLTEQPQWSLKVQQITPLLEIPLVFPQIQSEMLSLGHRPKALRNLEPGSLPCLPFSNDSPPTHFAPAILSLLFLKNSKHLPSSGP